MLCAVLVQNPANLGALCRTAEVFRLEGLVVAELAIAKHPQFRNAAVSSHLWQPLIECAPAQLLHWLKSQRARGYSIVALHPHTQQHLLPQFTFPPQTILLLGQELTGVPASLLDECDYRLAIPQYGLVESLNVQTAGAIASYEYIRQHGLSVGSAN